LVDSQARSRWTLGTNHSEGPLASSQASAGLRLLGVEHTDSRGMRLAPQPASRLAMRASRFANPS